MVLQFINEQMDLLAIPYEFGEWTSDVKYPYSVGELTEVETATEDGSEEYQFILTIFHRTSESPYADIEEIKNKIKKHFHPINGIRRQIMCNVIVGYYGGAFYVPTGEADLKKLQINLTIKQWKGEI